MLALICRVTLAVHALSCSQPMPLPAAERIATEQWFVSDGEHGPPMIVRQDDIRYSILVDPNRGDRMICDAYRFWVTKSETPVDGMQAFCEGKQ